MWDYEQWGTAQDPIRQSDLNALLGEHNCARSWMFGEAEHALHGRRVSEHKAPWKRTMGTAIHSAIETCLRGSQFEPDEDMTRSIIDGSLASAADGLPINWDYTDKEDALDAAVHQVRGALKDVEKRARLIIAIEAPFKFQHPTLGYEFEGTIDLVFRNKRGVLSLADWKTGDWYLNQNVLNHGYQLGLYSWAVKHSTLFVGDPSREQRVNEYPRELWIVQTADYVPQKRTSRKQAKRPEEAQFFDVRLGGYAEVKAGEQKGPAWYQSRRTEADDPRLMLSVRQAVRQVRLGIFPEKIGSGCERCLYKGPCFQDGFAADSSEGLIGLEDGFGT